MEEFAERIGASGVPVSGVRLTEGGGLRLRHRHMARAAPVGMQSSRCTWTGERIHRGVGRALYGGFGDFEAPRIVKHCQGSSPRLTRNKRAAPRRHGLESGGRSSRRWAINCVNGWTWPEPEGTWADSDAMEPFVGNCSLTRLKWNGFWKTRAADRGGALKMTTGATVDGGD